MVWHFSLDFSYDVKQLLRRIRVDLRVANDKMTETIQHGESRWQCSFLVRGFSAPRSSVKNGWLAEIKVRTIKVEREPFILRKKVFENELKNKNKGIYNNNKIRKISATKPGQPLVM